MNIFSETDKETLVELYDYFQGLRENSQRRKLGEEHQELIEALQAFELGCGDIRDVIAEIADNFILLFQHIYALDITDEEVKDAIKEKFARTIQRKKDKYYENCPRISD